MAMLDIEISLFRFSFDMLAPRVIPIVETQFAEAYFARQTCWQYFGNTALHILHLAFCC